MNVSKKKQPDTVVKIEDEERNPDTLDLKQFDIIEDNEEDRTRDYISSLTSLSSICSQNPLPYTFIPAIQDSHPSESPGNGTEKNRPERCYH